jgi:hypothetical protein
MGGRNEVGGGGGDVGGEEWPEWGEWGLEVERRLVGVKIGGRQKVSLGKSAPYRDFICCYCYLYTCIHNNK